MDKLLFLCLLFFLLYFILYLLSEPIIEKHLPFYSSPPRRWGGYDLRYYPYIPKRYFPWNNSSYNYYYRSRALI